jgi:broad specificity phosphatase PhoE
MRRVGLVTGAAVVLVASLVGPCIRVAAAQEAVYLVRHAERASDDKQSLLSPEGHVRASRLAEILRDAGITDIFVSEYQRTAETAGPLGSRLGITPRVVAADRGDELLAAVRAAGPKARVLIAGHSDTVPALIKAFGCPQEISIAKAEYDNLFVVVPGNPAGPILLRLRY